MLMSERIAGRWGGKHGRCGVSSFSSCRCILFVHKCLRNVITSLWAMRHYFPLTFAIYLFHESSFVSWAWLQLHRLALPRAWPSPPLAAPVSATTRAEKKSHIKTPQEREALSKVTPSHSHSLPRSKDASLLDKREPSRKAKPGAQMTQARKCSGGVAPTVATSPIAAVLVHRLSICSVSITSQNGPVPALLKDGTGGTKVWGIVSPVSWGCERASSKHPLQTQTLQRQHSFACQQPVHKKLLGSGADRAGAAPFLWQVSETGLSLPPPFPPLYPLSPSAAPLPKALISSITITCTESVLGSSSGSWWKGGTSRLWICLIFSVLRTGIFTRRKKVHF